LRARWSEDLANGEKTGTEANTNTGENRNSEVLPDEIGVLSHRSRTLQKGRTRHEILVT